MEKIIALVVAIAVLITVAFLIIFRGGNQPHFLENTVNEFFFDVDDAVATAGKLARGNYKSELDIFIDGENANRTTDLGLNLKAQGFRNGENIKEKISYNMRVDENKHRGEIFYVNDTLYFVGYDKDGEEFCINLPLNEAFENLDGSVFNPDNNTDFSMARDTYDRIKRALAEDEDDELEKELERFIKDLLPKIKEQIKIKTENGDDGETKYSISIDTETINAIIDTVATELLESEILCRRMALDSVTIDSFKASLKQALKNFTVDIILVEKDNLLKSARIYVVNKENYYPEKLDISMVFSKQKGGVSALVTITNTTGPNVVKTASIKYTKVKYGANRETTVAFLNEGEEAMRFVLGYNRLSDRYTVEYFTPDSGDSPEMTMKGKAGYYGGNRGVHFTIEKYVDEDCNLNDCLEFYIKTTGSGRWIRAPKDGKSILEMNESQLHLLIDSIDYEKIDDSLWRGFGKKLNLSEDKIPIMNYSIALKETEAVKQLLQIYHSKFGRDLSKIYYYIPSCGVYAVVESYGYFDSSYTTRLCAFPGKIIQTHHQARIVNGMFTIHNYVVVSETQADCYNDGYVTLWCTDCGDQKETVSAEATNHSSNKDYFTTEYTYDVGKTESVRVTYCKDCKDIIDILFIDGQNYMYFYEGDKVRGAQGHSKHLIIHDNIAEKVDISDLSLYNEYFLYSSLLSVRIPKGRTVIKKGDFCKAPNLQVLALPNTLTEIENGAFDPGVPIHTIFFEGTEEQWEKINLNEYKSLWADVEVIFVPDGVDPETIMGECTE